MNEFDKILIEQGVSLVPRVTGTKVPPAGFNLTERWDGKKIATLEECQTWKDHDRAAVSGVNSLVVFDADSEIAYETLWGKKTAERLPSETLSVKTSRGIQTWFFDKTLDYSRLKSWIDCRPIIDFEILIQRHLAAVPGNTHPSGAKYELMGTKNIMQKDGVVNAVVERLTSLHWIGSIYSKSLIITGQPSDRVLTESFDEKDLERGIEFLTPFWIASAKSHELRFRFMLALSGFFIRRNASENAAVQFVERLTEAANDIHAKRRAPTRMRALYRSSSHIDHVQGLPTLLEVMKEIEKRSTLLVR